MAHNTPSASRLPKVPGRSADIDEVWAYLVTGIDLIMTRSEGDISSIEYTYLYTTVYNYCTSTKLHSRTNAGIRTSANLVGADLYSKLSNYFIEYIHPMMEKSECFQDVNLLRYYASEWDRFTKNVGCLTRVFSYLDRTGVEINPKENKENKGNKGTEGSKGKNKDVYRVSTLALTQWKACFLAHIQQDNAKLTNTILCLITQQRGGGLIDEDLVKKVVHSFVLLGLDNSNPNKECLDLYRDQFEALFLRETEKYYEAESEVLVAKNSVSEYLKKVEERLREEGARVKSYLHADTRKNLLGTCEHVLIRAHSELMWESFQSLLEFGRDEDLQRMYALLSRIPQGLEPLYKRFESHIKQVGLTAVSKIVEGGANVEFLDPKAYVDALLEVYRRNSEILQRCLEGEAGFAASLDKACREFVNHNAATGSLPTKSGELIAEYVNILLHNDRMVQDDIEGALMRVVVLINYVEDKSVFQAFYAGKLSKYLVHHVSGAESQTSIKPEETHGPEVTNAASNIPRSAGTEAPNATGISSQPQEIAPVEATNPAGIISQPEKAPGTEATNVPSITSQPMEARGPDACGSEATKAPYIEPHQESARSMHVTHESWMSGHWWKWWYILFYFVISEFVGKWWK